MANNVINRVWNQNRMVTIEDLKGMVFQAESGGHTFQISGVDDAGNVIALSGSVAGVFLRPDNTDVAITGSASGGVVSVTLPPECYDVPGRFGLTVFVTYNGQKTAVYAAIGTVSRTSSGTVSPGTSADVVDLINRIKAAIESIPEDYSVLEGDVNNLKTAIAGNNAIEITESGKYIVTNQSAIDISHVVESVNYSYSLVRCQQGDIFTINATGGIAPRAWAFIAQDGQRLTVAAENAVCDYAVITAPENAYYLIINDSSNRTSYYGLITSTTNLKNSVYTTAKDEVPVVDWLIGKQYNASGALISLSYSICSADYIPLIKGLTYTIAVNEGYRCILREYDNNGAIVKSTTVAATTKEIVFSYDNVNISILSDSQTPASVSFADQVKIVNSELDVMRNSIADASENIASLENTLQNTVLMTQKVGESIEVPKDKTVSGIKVYAKTALSTLNPTYNNPATYTAPSETVLSLSKGLTLASLLSLDRVSQRTQTINITTVAAGYHSVTIDIDQYTANGNVTFDFRNSSNSSVGTVAIAKGSTGKVVKNVTLSGEAAKIYAYISSSATDGVLVCDIKIDADLVLSTGSMYGVPIAGGGQCTMNGRIYLNDVFNFITKKVTHNVTVLAADAVTTATRLNKIDGNTLFSISREMTSALLNKRMPNYFCTHFTPETTGYDSGNVGMYIWDNSIRFRIPSSIADTVEDFVAWYKENNVTVFYPSNNPSVSDMPASISAKYDAIMSHSVLDEITITNGYVYDVNFNDTYDASEEKITLPQISPENFGATGDGVTDDTDAVQSAINQAIATDGVVVCASSAKYAVKGLYIGGRMTLDGNGCTIKGTTNNPVITVYKTTNKPNGYIKNVVIDMQNISSIGIYIVHDARTQYQNITLNNPAVNGFGIKTSASTAGCGFNTINGRSEEIPGTTFIYVDSADMNFNNIDWQNYVIGIDVTHKANAILQNVHGYMAITSLFNDSIFLRTESRLSIVNAYPDTQRRFFVINTNRGVSIIGGSSWYNGDSVDMSDKEQGYAFYSDKPSNLGLVSVVGFNFSQPADGVKPYAISNQETSPTFIGCYTSTDDGASILGV